MTATLPKCTLIITEKPDAASRIATALDETGKPKKKFENGVPYYLAHRNGDIVVAPALGHLYTVASKKIAKHDYPDFDYQWVPRYETERGATRIRAWIKVISTLAESSDKFIDACDFDIEGSIVGYSILKYACRGKEKVAKRMKYSTLTKLELQESYEHLMPQLDFALVEAGLTRHEVDWLYGINLSRALIAAAKSKRGHYNTLSTGRVQGPTLKLLEKREKSIRCFVPTPYWNVAAKLSIDGKPFVAEFEKILETRREANIVLESCKTKEAQIEKIEIEQFMLNPPVPFDLGTLQKESSRLFRYTPIRTSNIAQQLYVNALISYPRTSSQKLPAVIGYKTILQRLSKYPDYGKQASELLSKTVLKPNEGEKTDSAHPAIYPTGDPIEKSISAPETNVLDLIIRRFMAVFGESAVRQRIRVALSINGNHFYLSGVETLSEGWLKYYHPYAQVKDVVLPQLMEGQRIVVKRIVLKDNYTKPPSRYSSRSLLLKMENENIGTKATRAAIIQTLHERKYIQGTDALYVSDLGFDVSEILSTYCPTVLSIELTRKLEEEMVSIQQGKETKFNVLKDTIEILQPVLAKLKEKEQEIGTKLEETLNQLILQEKTVGHCPKCIDGKLMILHSKKTKQRFVGCTNYFKDKCNAAFPLPQKGIINPLKRCCKTCGWPILHVWLNSKRAWTLCLNPSCPSKGANHS